MLIRAYQKTGAKVFLVKDQFVIQSAEPYSKGFRSQHEKQNTTLSEYVNT
jgi:hypothetical protein